MKSVFLELLSCSVNTQLKLYLPVLVCGSPKPVVPFNKEQAALRCRTRRTGKAASKPVTLKKFIVSKNDQNTDWWLFEFIPDIYSRKLKAMRFKQTTHEKTLPLAIHVCSAYLHEKLLRVLDRTSVCNQTFTLKLKELQNPALNVKEHIKYNSTALEESNLPS